MSHVFIIHSFMNLRFFFFWISGHESWGKGKRLREKEVAIDIKHYDSHKTTHSSLSCSGVSMIQTFESQTNWAKCQSAITSQVALLLADLCPRYSKLATVKATKAIQAESFWLEYIPTARTG